MFNSLKLLKIRDLCSIHHAAAILNLEIDFEIFESQSQHLFFDVFTVPESTQKKANFTAFIFQVPQKVLIIIITFIFS